MKEKEKIKALESQVEELTKKLSDALVGDLSIDEILVNDESLTVSFGGNLAKAYALAFDSLLGSAENYVELHCEKPDGEKITVTIQKPYGKSPAEMQAEAEDIVAHCWVHSGYPDCGSSQMTTTQKEVYKRIVDSRVKKMDDEYGSLEELQGGSETTESGITESKPAPPTMEELAKAEKHLDDGIPDWREQYDRWLQDRRRKGQ